VLGSVHIQICTVRSESRCALRLRLSAVEMWWHTVTHGRGSSESRCALVLEVMSTSVYTRLNPFNFILHHSSTGLYRCLRAQWLSERTVHLANAMNTENIYSSVMLWVIRTRKVFLCLVDSFNVFGGSALL